MNVINQFAVFRDMGIGVHALHAQERKLTILRNECVPNDDQADPAFCESFIQFEQGLGGKTVRVTHVFMSSGSNQPFLQFQVFDAGPLEECRYGASFH